MPQPPNKKQKTAVAQNDHDQPSDDENSNSDISMENVDVNFEAITPEECDLDGIKKLMNQLFVGSAVDVSALTNYIFEKKSVTSVVRQFEENPSDDEGSDLDDDIFALITVIDLSDKAECVQSIKNHLLDMCKQNEPKMLNKFTGLLEGKVGCVMCERFVNIGAQISFPLYQCLIKDMQDAHMTFDRILMISKQFYLPNVPTVYANPEDEEICSLAEFSFRYKVPRVDKALSGTWGPGGIEMNQVRSVIIIPQKEWLKIPDIISKALVPIDAE